MEGRSSFFYSSGLPLEIPQTIACSTVFVLYSVPLLQFVVYMFNADSGTA